MPKKLKYQYSVSVSFMEKSVQKQTNQADLKNGGELEFLLKRHQPQTISDLMSFIMKNTV